MQKNKIWSNDWINTKSVNQLHETRSKNKKLRLCILNTSYFERLHMFGRYFQNIDFIAELRETSLSWTESRCSYRCLFALETGSWESVSGLTSVCWSDYAEPHPTRWSLYTTACLLCLVAGVCLSFTWRATRNEFWTKLCTECTGCTGSWSSLKKLGHGALGIENKYWN
jgi:hypothetical protein